MSSLGLTGRERKWFTWSNLAVSFVRRDCRTSWEEGRDRGREGTGGSKGRRGREGDGGMGSREGGGKEEMRGGKEEMRGGEGRERGGEGIRRGKEGGERGKGLEGTNKKINGESKEIELALFPGSFLWFLISAWARKISNFLGITWMSCHHSPDTTIGSPFQSYCCFRGLGLFRARVRSASVTKRW